MFKKSFYCLLMISFLLSHHPIQSNAADQQTTKQLMRAFGLILGGGGTYLLVKNPKNKEGIISRSFRTVSALCIMALGFDLILHSNHITEKDSIGNSFLTFLISEGAGFAQNMSHIIHLITNKRTNHV